MEELMEFIQANPDPRELKRALAVKMVMQMIASPFLTQLGTSAPKSISGKDFLENYCLSM
ncbi:MULTISPECIES: hypothetical protein [Nostocales]